jgi:hypothetical protein
VAVIHTRPEWEHFCLIVFVVSTAIALLFHLVRRYILPRKAYRTLHSNKFSSLSLARNMERTGDAAMKYRNLAGVVAAAALLGLVALILT